MEDHLGTVITGTIGVDAHVIGTKVISRALREAGFKVVELGAQTPAEEFIMAAQETAADAMMISSLYGMAEMDLEGFRDKCTEAGLERHPALRGRHPGRVSSRLRRGRSQVQGDGVRPRVSARDRYPRGYRGPQGRPQPEAGRAPVSVGRAVCAGRSVLMGDTRLFVDFGSTFTKLVAFDLEAEELLGRVQVPSTVERRHHRRPRRGVLSPGGDRSHRRGRTSAHRGLQQRRRWAAGRLRRAGAGVHHRGGPQGGPGGGGQDRRVLLLRAHRGRTARDRGDRPGHRASHAAAPTAATRRSSRTTPPCSPGRGRRHAPRGVEWWLRARDYLLQGLTVR